MKEKAIVSACGLNCGLCSRFHTNGTSRCPGCDGVNFNNCRPNCGVLKCCSGKKHEYCYECDDYPCSKYSNALKDSFITHQNIFENFNRVKENGIDKYLDEINEKMKILKLLLSKYDDGRRKSFYCLAINLLDINSINEVLSSLTEDISVKEIVALFEEKAKEKGIVLKLNR